MATQPCLDVLTVVDPVDGLTAPCGLHPDPLFPSFVPVAGQPVVFPGNFPPLLPYFLAEAADLFVNSQPALITFGLEASFVGDVPLAGAGTVFQSLFIRINPAVLGTYTLQHPWGEMTFVCADIDCRPLAGTIAGGLQLPFAIPAEAVVNFDAARDGNLIGSFLQSATVLPLGLERYLGDGITPGPVTGGTVRNSIIVTDPNGIVTSTSNFVIVGKKIGMIITPPVGGTDFGTVKLAPGAVTKTFTLTNQAGVAVTPVITAVPATDFSIVPSAACASLADAATCTFDVIFSPIAPDGARTATISITSGDTVPPAQTTVTGTADGTAPTVALDTPIMFSILPSKTITGTVADNVGGAGINPATSVQVSVNGGAAAAATVNVTAGTWSFLATGLNTTDAVNNNSVSVTAADLALPDGNTSAAVTGTITVDSILPAVAITSPVTGLTNNNTPNLTFTATDTNLSSTVVTVDGVAVNTASGAPMALLADGQHTVQVEALDAAGNATVAAVDFTVDTLPPVITLTAPAVGGFTNDNTPLLTFSVTDASAVTNVVMVDTIVVATLSGGSLAQLADGPHTVIVESTDAVGRISTATATFTVDTALPAVAITAPVTGLTKINTPSLTFTATDTNLATTVVKVDGAAVNTVTGANLALLADGPHTVRVETTDAAGNISFAEVNISVDTTPPTLTLALTPENTPTRVTSQTISGTVEVGATVVVTTNTTAAARPVDIVGATWSTTIIGLVEGANGITVTATDPVGNPANQQSSINIVLPNGDINGDAAVTIGDAQKSLQFAAGLIQPTAVEALHADVAPLVNNISSPNGKVDTGDVMLILRKSVGLVNWQINN